MPVYNKKTYSDFSADDDYDIVDIYSNFNEIQLSFALNTKLKWQLKRLSDFGFDDNKGQLNKFALYHFAYEELTNIYLIKPIQAQAAILSTCYLILHGVVRPEFREQLITEMHSIQGVFTATVINLNLMGTATKRNPLLAQLTNLLYHMESHLLDLYQKEKKERRINEFKTY
jgi:hypothetical protein